MRTGFAAISIAIAAFCRFQASVISEEAVCQNLSDEEDGTCTTSVSNEKADNDNPSSSSSSSSALNTECHDSREECGHWASLGECSANAPYMKVHCQFSCGTCAENYDVSNEDEMEDINQDVIQILDAEEWGVSSADIQNVMDASLEYLTNKVSDPLLLELCINKHEMCAVWAVMGECQANESYMQTNCAPVCQTCHMMTIEGRCPVDPNAPLAWKAGDLDKLFRRLTSEQLYDGKYPVQVLSSPESTGGPWIITLDDIISNEEADRLIALGKIEGYKQSLEATTPGADGKVQEIVSEERTSYNAWCQNDCYQDPDAQRVIHRLSNLTLINETNSEYLQLLRYEPGQFYRLHHDYIPSDIDRQQGPRILTLFLYLNTVEAGGETEFTGLGIKVAPKKGRALLWPNVLDEDPMAKDARTQHQALDLLAGSKFGANAWFHIRDFKTPNRNHCQG